MTSYLIKTKKSNELTDKDWFEYSESFNRVFEKKLSADYFKSKYFGSSFGYSVHGILYFNDIIAGMFTVIPRTYIMHNKEVIIGLGCDAFILKEHRKDESFLKLMADSVIDLLKKEGVRFFISIPNKTAYPYWKYYAGWHDIGKLNYYIIPLRLSRLINKRNFPDWLFFIVYSSLIRIISSIFPFSSSHQKKEIDIKRDENLLSQRYNSDYQIRIDKNNEGFIYRIFNEDGIRTAYLIDCFPLSQKNLAKAINQVIKESGKRLDIILFVGKIEEPPFFLLKVPERKEPRLQPFIGLSGSESEDLSFYSFDFWNLSLANFDNR